MKKQAFTFLAVMASVFTFSRCQQDERSHAAYFWTSTPPAEQPLTLFVDGQARGTLPYFSNSFTCGQDSLKQQALQMSLNSGKYYLEAKTNQGEVRSSGSLKISDSGMSSKGTVGDKGGMAASSSGSGNSCVIVDLFY